MNPQPTETKSLALPDADKQSGTSLRKEAAAWTKANRAPTVSPVSRDQPAVTTGSVPKAKAPAKADLPAPNRQPAPTSQGKAPFGMSYGGVTAAEHVAYRIARGAR